MAILVGNKAADFQYRVQCIQIFLMEFGRVRAVLNSTILQSDQEDHLIAKQLRHQAYKQTSHRGMDGETHSLPSQQVRHTLRWQHKLLQEMAQRTQDTTL